jgi:hypothetical protein
MARTSSRTTKTYPSKVDAWILVLIAAAIGSMVVGMGISLAQEGLLRFMQGAFVVLGIIGFLVWIMLGTGYTLESDQLVARSGPFSWKIALADITSIEQAKGYMRLKSGPTMSMDRLTITYRGGKRLNISPADKQGFLKEIAARGART